jgi:hypothetical protein
VPWKELTQLGQGLIRYCAHLERTHASLVVDEEDELVPVFELDV